MVLTSTITRNTALQGGGIYDDNPLNPPSGVWFVNGTTTVTRNTPDDCVGC